MPKKEAVQEVSHQVHDQGHLRRNPQVKEVEDTQLSEEAHHAISQRPKIAPALAEVHRLHLDEAHQEKKLQELKAKVVSHPQDVLQLTRLGVTKISLKEIGPHKQGPNLVSRDMWKEEIEAHKQSKDLVIQGGLKEDNLHQEAEAKTMEHTIARLLSVYTEKGTIIQEEL